MKIVPVAFLNVWDFTTLVNERVVLDSIFTGNKRNEGPRLFSVIFLKVCVCERERVTDIWFKLTQRKQPFATCVLIFIKLFFPHKYDMSSL